MARILVVDDDPTVLALERLILSDAGHEVLLADTARTAMGILLLYQVDLLIADVMMPEINGFQFVNLIKNNPKLQKFPVAFLTAKCDRQDVVRAGELGADLYIMKPIDRGDFLAKITTHFKNHPPKEYPKVKFRELCSAEAKVSHSVKIISLSDLSLEILTDAHLELDQVMELSASVFQEIPLRQPLLRVLSIQPDKSGLHRVGLTFLNMDADTVRQIQRWISYKALKP